MARNSAAQQPQAMQHYSDGRVNTISYKRNKPDRDAIAKKVARQREIDEQMIVGIFKNLETPGGSLSFSFRLYDGPSEEYCLQDGERYRLPRGVWAHLSNNCFYPEWKHANGQSGEAGIRTGLADGKLKPIEHAKIARKVHRFACQSLEFMDPEMDFAPIDLVEVHHA